MDLHSVSSVKFTAFTSEDYEQYVKLMHKVAKRQFGILQNTNSPEEYEDVFQNVVIDFLQAKEGFDESKGFKFSTYAVRACENNFLNRLQKASRFQPEYLEAMKNNDGEGDWNSFIADENAMDYQPSLKAKIAEAGKKISTLSLLAKLVVRELISPCDEIVQAHKAKLEFAKRAKEIGGKVPFVREDIDYNFIFSFYKVKKEERIKTIKELTTVFEL